LRSAGLTAFEMELLNWRFSDDYSYQQIADTLEADERLAAPPDKATVFRWVQCALDKLTEAGLPLPRETTCDPPREIGVDPDVLERLAVMPDPRGFDE